MSRWTNTRLSRSPLLTRSTLQGQAEGAAVVSGGERRGAAGADGGTEGREHACIALPAGPCTRPPHLRSSSTTAFQTSEKTSHMATRLSSKYDSTAGRVEG